MSAYETILAKQMAWAQSRGICLRGSKDECTDGRGTKCYTAHLDANLFVPLSKSTETSFREGSGKELEGKMRALHSSSAIAVNVFEYWNKLNDPATIAEACGLCKKGSDAAVKIVFEEKYAVDKRFSTPPNIDVVIHCKDGSRIQRYGIECKFTEAYQNRGHGGMAAKYFEESINLWSDIPNLEKLAVSIQPDDNRFAYLHAAQLIKHALGLKRHCGKRGFRLLYLWYDALGEPGYQHRAEVQEFAAIAKADGILFHSMTYQELIVRLTKTLEPQHQEYSRYLATRYL
jgi:hypothetical protein